MTSHLENDPRQPKNPNGGFTLAELLVVIAVIAVLAALTITGGARAKGKAQRLKCASNLRQVGLSLQSFVADNTSYPLYVGDPTGDWVAVLQHTVLSNNNVKGIKYREEGVWKCPTAQRPANLPKDDGYFSYGYNSFGLWGKTDVLSLGLGGHNLWYAPWYAPRNSVATHWPAPPVRESEVEKPSEMMAVGDSFVGGGGIINDGGLLLGRTTGLRDFYGSTKRSSVRHQGLANVVFCDGHLECLKLKFLFEDTNDDALRIWNRDGLPHRERL